MEKLREYSRKWRKEHPGAFIRKGETIEEARMRWAVNARRQYDKKVREAKFIPSRLCLCGCGQPIFAIKAKWIPGHAPRTKGMEWGSTSKARRPPVIIEIAWAAGFLEGEGWFTGRQDSRTGYVLQQVGSSQVQREPLDRLAVLFGGRVYARSGGKFITLNGNPSIRQNYFRWYVNQVRARGVMMTLYSFMSPRRKEQIKKSLDSWRKTKIPAAINAVFGKVG